MVRERALAGPRYAVHVTLSRTLLHPTADSAWPPVTPLSSRGARPFGGPSGPWPVEGTAQSALGRPTTTHPSGPEPRGARRKSSSTGTVARTGALRPPPRRATETTHRPLVNRGYGRKTRSTGLGSGSGPTSGGSRASRAKWRSPCLILSVYVPQRL